MSKNNKNNNKYKLSLPFIHIVQGMFLSFVFLSYPGQNYWQTLVLHPQIPKVRGFSIQAPNFTIPLPTDDTPVPTVSAQAAIVFEPDSGTIIWGRNIDQPLHPASTTKLITALTVLDLYQPDQILTIKDSQKVIGSAMHFKIGETFTTIDLLKAMLISSANDAAFTFAENYPQGYNGFMQEVNNKIDQLHLSHTHFTNVSGIDDADHVTTVHDLALVAKAVSNNSLILDITSQKTASISSQEGHPYQLNSTNELLGQIPGLRGLKTGWTQDAGECLVTLTERNNRKLISVVLNSKDRFGDSKSLIEWVWGHYSW